MADKPIRERSKTVGFKDRLKNLLNLQKESVAESEHHRTGARGSTFLTPTLLHSIGPESDLWLRLKTLNDLKSIISSKHLEDGAIETIWLHIQDLILLDRNDEGAVRREALDFIIALCRGQYSKLNLCRVSFFNVLKNCSKSDDLRLNFDLLKALTNDGQSVEDFEEDLGDLLTVYVERLGLLTTGHQRELTKLFLDCIKILLKLHAVCFAEEHLKCIVQFICIYACQTNVDDDVLVCLSVLDVILCYAYWPKSSLLVVVTTLCKLVNKVTIYQDVWRCVRNLLGSHFGHSAVYVMCGLLQASESYPDHSILRGAVFFIGMSLWGPQKVENLRHTPCSILPSLLQAIQCNSTMVTFEVLVTSQRLIQKYGRQLQIITWDLIMQILERVQEVHATNTASAGRNQKDVLNLMPIFHDILTTVEKYYEQNLFNGSPEQLYALIERCSKDRPDISIYRLLNYRLQSISPTKSQWLNQLRDLADVYYKRDARTEIRIKMVNILADMYAEYRHLYGDDYIEHVILPTFATFDSDSDSATLTAVLHLLLDVCKYSTKNTFREIIDLLEKLMIDRLYSSANWSAETCSAYFDVVELALVGLIDVIKHKWNIDPAADCVQICKLLINHVTLQYERNFNGIAGGECRATVANFFLSFRADRTTGRLTYAWSRDEPRTPSYYIYCLDEMSPTGCDDSANHPLCTVYTSAHSLRFFTSVIAQERYWPCLHTVTSLLPDFLHNRTFVLSGEDDHLNQLCSNLLYLCDDPLRSSKLQSAPDNMTQLELNEFIYPSLCALVPYRIYFSDNVQQKLAMTIQAGVVSQKSAFVIMATTICILEMPEVMRPMMKDLVRRMAELPSTPLLAIPTFELMSTFMRIRQLYDDFAGKHYEYVFSIMTPYTNPFRFTELIVAMAYQVIFRFFLCVPLPRRHAVARYVLKSVGAPMSRPVSGAEINALASFAAEDATSGQLHSNLTALNRLARQVLLIFLSHYSFRDQPPVRRRTRVARLLFDSCKTKHWLVGDRLLSVSVSADCGIDESGLCASCRRTLCINRPQATASGNNNATSQFIRRRYKSAVQRRVTPQAMGHAPPHSLDDSCIASSSVSGSDGGQLAAVPSRKTSLGAFYTTPTADSSYSSLRPATVVEFEAERQRVPPFCTCWCRGFVEICIRHAFGHMSWVVWHENGDTRWNGGTPDRNEAFYMLADAKLSTESTGIGEFDEFLRKESWSDFLKTSSVGRLFNVDSSELVASSLDDRDDSFTSGVSPVPVEDCPPSMMCQTGDLSNESSLPYSTNLTVTVDDSSVRRSDALSTSSTYYSAKSEPPSRKADAIDRDSTLSDAAVDSSESLYFLLQFFSPYLFKDSDDNVMTPVYALPENDAVERALKNLDRISSQELQKVGVLYVGSGQTTEAEILANQCGSARYDRFLAGLGKLISLKDVNQEETFIGGLSTDGRDGQFTYVWSDQVTQLVFHVATLMPNKESDKASNEKKRHIGNNLVTVVFNESNSDYKLTTISGQFSYVAIVVEPLDEGTMSIKLKAKDEISKWLSLKTAVLSDEKVPLLCRQMSMRAELSARIWAAQQNTSEDVYLSRSLERLKQIRHIREKFRGKPLTVDTAFDN